MPSQLSNEVLMSAETIAQADTHYSSSMDFRRCAGNAVLLVISTAGVITISQQCSYNGIDWYDPVDYVGGTLGVIQSLLTVTTGVYVPFTPVMAPYIRFKVVEGNTAPTVVTLRLVYRLET